MPGTIPMVTRYAKSPARDGRYAKITNETIDEIYDPEDQSVDTGDRGVPVSQRVVGRWLPITRQEYETVRYQGDKHVRELLESIAREIRFCMGSDGIPTEWSKGWVEGLKKAEETVLGKLPYHPSEPPPDEPDLTVPKIKPICLTEGYDPNWSNPDKTHEDPPEYERAFGNNVSRAWKELKIFLRI